MNTLGYVLRYIDILYDIHSYSSGTNSISIKANNELSLDDNQYLLLSLDDYIGILQITILLPLHPMIKLRLPSYAKNQIKQDREYLEMTAKSALNEFQE